MPTIATLSRAGLTVAALLLLTAASGAARPAAAGIMVSPSVAAGPERDCAGRECTARATTGPDSVQAPDLVWTPASWAAMNGVGEPPEVRSPAWVAVFFAAVAGAMVAEQIRPDDDGGGSAADDPSADPAKGRLVLVGSALGLAAAVAYVRGRSRRPSWRARRALRARERSQDPGPADDVFIELDVV